MLHFVSKIQYDNCNAHRDVGVNFLPVCISFPVPAFHSVKIESRQYMLQYTGKLQKTSKKHIAGFSEKTTPRGRLQDNLYLLNFNGIKNHHVFCAFLDHRNR